MYKWSPVPAREWAGLFALETRFDWFPICGECAQYVSADYLVNYNGGSPYLYTCKLCGVAWETLVDVKEFVVMSNVVEKKKIVRDRKRKDRELTIARKETRRTHARNGGRW